jgi:hypothetical protein
MRVKTCSRCGAAKPLDQYPPVRRGQPKLQSWCRACFAENNVRYYREHRETQRARLSANTAARREENHRRVVEYLSAHACFDCGEMDIVVLQFDHLGDKRANVSALIASGASWARVAEEIAKCDVRCANCHRRKTATAWPELVIDAAAVIAATRPTGRPLQLRLEPGQIRTCRVCGQNKSLHQFPVRSVERQTHQWICLECQRAYSKSWYRRNRRRSIAAAGRRNTSRRKTARAKVGGARTACADCCETNPLLLDFDHLWDKRADVSYMVHAGMSLATIATEIDKCAIRCANCHARKTAREQGSYRTKVGGL